MKVTKPGWVLVTVCIVAAFYTFLFDLAWIAWNTLGGEKALVIWLICAVALGELQHRHTGGRG